MGKLLQNSFFVHAYTAHGLDGVKTLSYLELHVQKSLQNVVEMADYHHYGSHFSVVTLLWSESLSRQHQS
jgi:hypothetical protein